MSTFLIFTSLVTILFVTAYVYVKKSLSYWKRRGVPFKNPTFPFGNFAEAFSKKNSFDNVVKDIYNSTSEPFIGVYTFIQPALLVRDPKLIQDMCCKNFHSFSHRGMQANVDVDPMADNILLQKGEKWRRMRTQTSPAFTSNKLKGMFETIVRCGKTLEKYVEQFSNNGKSVEMRELFARYTINVIVTVAFGIDIDCFDNPECEFRKYGQQVFDPTVRNMLRNTLSFMTPKLAKWLKIRFADKEIGDFMIEAIRQNVEYREKNDVTRKDFFQLLMQLRNTGKVREDDDWSAKPTSVEKSLTLEEFAAQAYLFLAAGFESSSSTISFCMFELAKHPEIQQKVYDEIVSVLQKNNDQLTYDSVAEMKYLDSCIDESLRLHPPFAIARRRCTKDYIIPGTNVTIEEGTTIMFSASGLQNDSKYYAEPTKYIPERYNNVEATKKTFIDMPNLAFGEGMRNCLGMRMGLLQSKLAILLLLKKFKFELGNEHLNGELLFNPTSIVLATVNGINLKIISR